MATTTPFDGRLTYDDLARMPDDDLRHEIIDGVHYVTGSRSRTHQRVLRRLLVTIDEYLETHPIGEVFSGPMDVVLTRWDVVAPDLLFVAADQSSILTDANVQGAPAIVAEVLSEETMQRDIVDKQQLYDRAGVREYWIIDPVASTLTVHHGARDGSFKLREVLADAGESLTTPLMPGFSLPLDKLFRK